MANCDFKRIQEAYPEFNMDEVKSVAAEIKKMQDGSDFSIAFQKRLEKDVFLAKKIAAEDIAHVKKVRETVGWVRDHLAHIKEDKAFSSADFMKTGGANEPLLAKLVGTDKTGKGARVSVKTINNSVRAELNNNLNRPLEKSGHFDKVATGDFDIESGRVLDAMESGGDLSGFSREAVAWAKIRKANYAQQINVAHSRKIPMGEIDNYAGRQTHSPELIAASVDNEWEDFLKSHMNEEPVHGGVGMSEVGVDEIIAEMKTNIIAGQFEPGSPGSFGGSRVIKFKNAESAAMYNAKYGTGTMLTTAQKANSSFAKYVAKYEMFGPRPDKIREFIEKETIKALNPEQAAKYMDNSILGGAKRTRDAVWNETFGYEMNPLIASPAKYTKSAILLTSAARLGSSFVTTIADIPNTFSQYKAATGDNGILNAFNMMHDFNKMFVSNKNLRETQQVLGLEIRSGLADHYARSGVGDAPGMGEHSSFLMRKADAINQKFIQATGLPRQTETGHAVSALMFAKKVAKDADTDFDKLNPRMKASLEGANITKSDWNDIRNSVVELESGVKVVSVEDLMASTKTRKAGEKLNIFLVDAAHTGIQESTALERGALITRGLNPDSLEGSVAKLMGVFKSFSYARVRTFRRQILANPEIKGNSIASAFVEGHYNDLSVLASTVVSAAMLEGMATIIKRELKGKKTDTDFRFFLDSFQKAAAPISVNYILDAVKGEYNRYGRGMFKDMAGPVLGQMDDVVNMYGTVGLAVEGLINGDINPTGKMGIKITKFLLHNLPGNSLPVIPLVLDKVFMQGIYEAIDPEYARRKEIREARREKGYIYKALSE